jgi:hypothetical protein
MHPRIQELLDYLDAQHVALREAVESVPVARRNESPGPEQWSAAGVLEHLAIVETSIGRLLKDRITNARASGVGQESEMSSVIATFSPQSVILDRARRITASPGAHPKQNLSWEAALEAHDGARRELRDTLISADGLALGAVTHPHPVFGPLDLYHWFAFVGGHEARHAEQIRAVGRN